MTLTTVGLSSDTADPLRREPPVPRVQAVGTPPLVNSTGSENVTVPPFAAPLKVCDTGTAGLLGNEKSLDEGHPHSAVERRGREPDEQPLPRDHWERQSDRRW